jgi:ribulose-5-phosphate 4-epimerase/fuculose-1-phosphate aldolase
MHQRNNSEKLFDEFLLINKFVAQRVPFWTQGAGSNISVKLSKRQMLIKASGFRLDQVTQTVGWLEIDYFLLKENLAKIEISEAGEAEYSKIVNAAKSKTTDSARPSMESGFHALLEAPIVAHFHSLAAILMFHYFQNEKVLLQNWLEQQDKKWHWHFQEIIAPGLALSKALDGQKSNVIILQNHGVILQLNSLTELKEWADLELEFCRYFKLDCLLRCLSDQNFSFDDLLHEFSTGPFKIYFPDMVIYLAKVESSLNLLSNSTYQLKSDSKTGDFGPLELWLATQILFQTCPALLELDEPLAKQINNLPTEQLRKLFLNRSTKKDTE